MINHSKSNWSPTGCLVTLGQFFVNSVPLWSVVVGNLFWLEVVADCDLVFRCTQTSWRWGRSPSWWHSSAVQPSDPRASLPSASCIRPLRRQQHPWTPNSVKQRRRRRRQTNQPFEKCLFFFSVPAVSEVVSRETGRTSGSHVLDAIKALAELWPGRRRK